MPGARAGNFKFQNYVTLSMIIITSHCCWGPVAQHETFGNEAIVKYKIYENNAISSSMPDIKKRKLNSETDTYNKSLSEKDINTEQYNDKRKQEVK